MKLRIRGNSVRVRLTRSEVSRLGEGLSVEQHTQFGPGARLTSSVTPSAEVTAPAANFAGSTVAVILPLLQARGWAQTEQVAIEVVQDAGSGAQLTILVEKDFECVHSRAECDDDAFPNPRLHANTSRHPAG